VVDYTRLNVTNPWKSLVIVNAAGTGKWGWREG
jgi:hypothetical protein